MPCYDNRDAYVTEDLRQEVVRLRDRNHELTRLLCLVCSANDRAARLGIAVWAEELPSEVQTWWTEHQRMDAEREARESEDAIRNQQVAVLERDRERINAEIDRIRRGGSILSHARTQAAEALRVAEDGRVLDALDNDQLRRRGQR